MDFFKKGIKNADPNESLTIRTETARRSRIPYTCEQRAAVNLRIRYFSLALASGSRTYCNSVRRNHLSCKSFRLPSSAGGHFIL